VWCELDRSVVNHAIDEWRRHLSACVDAERLKADILNIAYDCYSQNNVKMATLNFITGDDFLFSFAVNANEQLRIIAFLTEKCCYLQQTVPDCKLTLTPHCMYTR